MDRYRTSVAVIAVGGLTLLAGCASTPVNIAPMPPASYQVLGKAKGEACGSFGILGPALNFIPMGLNSRVQNAHQRALASVSGATGLINVQMQDDWYWWWIATTRCTTVSGDAIREARR